MAMNFLQHGEALHYKVQTGDNIKSGDMVAVGKVVGVAITDGKVGELLTVSVQGVYEIPVPEAAGEIKQGDALYFNATAKELTTEDADVPAGFAWEDGAPGGVVPVKLLG